MGAEEVNGLSLEGLARRLETQAQKLDALEHENERISLENAELRSKAAVAAGTLLNPREAKATHYGNPISVDGVDTHWVRSFAEIGDSAVVASNISNNAAAVEAENTGTGPAVNGLNYSTGIGVRGISDGGYGGQFSGGKAQLMLVPKGSVGKPTSGAHTKGELYMDSAARLFVCTVSGTPGKWRKVTTTRA